MIDELADLMLVAPQRSRRRSCAWRNSRGRPASTSSSRRSGRRSTSSPGLIKANIPSRIAFAVSSQVDSRTILDMAGAERLLGRGDMLYLADRRAKTDSCAGRADHRHRGEPPRRFLGQARRAPTICSTWKSSPVCDDDAGKKDVDPLCYDAAKFIIESNYASTAALQSQFSIGHPRAVRVMKQLEDFKVVGPHEGTKPRRIILGLAELEQIAPRLGREGGQQDLFAAGA